MVGICSSPLPAHALAATLFVTGFIGIFLQVISQRGRKRLFLAAPPGSIASTIALTSRSGFGELLLPYDDERALGKKLDGLRFRLHKHTGDIVADEVETERPQSMASDDASLSLLGKTTSRESALPMSSSNFAHAAGKFPSPRKWVQFK